MRLKLKTAVAVIGTLALAVALIADAAAVATAARNAGHMCADTVVPSLFPFLVLSAYIVNSGIVKTLGRILRPITSFLFNLPGEAGTAILMGLIGGFPVGSKTTAALLKGGHITETEGKKMMLFTMNAGPAFVIGTVGVGMLGSIKIGLLIYSCMVLASIVLGIVLCIKLKSVKKENTDDRTKIGELSNEPNALTVSVESATKSMLLICAFIIIYAVVIEIIVDFTPIRDLFPPLLCNVFFGILEVTRGCKGISLYAAQNPTVILPIMTSILAFSGFCVHSQVLDCIRTTKVPYGLFVLSRIAAAALGGFFCRTALLLFPYDFTVFSNLAQNITSSTSLSIFACASLLLCAILLIFDLDIDEELC